MGRYQNALHVVLTAVDSRLPACASRTTPAGSCIAAGLRQREGGPQQGLGGGGGGWGSQLGEWALIPGASRTMMQQIVQLRAPCRRQRSKAPVGSTQQAALACLTTFSQSVDLLARWQRAQIARLAAPLWCTPAAACEALQAC